MSALTALDVAKYIVDYHQKRKSEINNLKVQKLLYFVDASFMKKNNGISLFHDDFEAWDYGPVIDEVYEHYKGNGSRPILLFNFLSDAEITVEVKNLIEKVVTHFWDTDAWELVDKTHKQDPWLKNYQSNQKNVIPKKEIFAYFQNCEVLD